MRSCLPMRDGRFPPAFVPAADEVRAPFFFHGFLHPLDDGFGYTSQRVAVEIDEVRVVDDELFAIGGERVLLIELLCKFMGGREVVMIFLVKQKGHEGTRKVLHLCTCSSCLLLLYLAHRIFCQCGDRQGWVDAGIGRHDRAINDIQPWIIMHFEIFIHNTFVRISSDRCAAQDVRGCWQAQ